MKRPEKKATKRKPTKPRPTVAELHEAARVARRAGDAEAAALLLSLAHEAERSA